MNSRSIQYVRARFMYLGVAGALIAGEGGVARHAVVLAQTRSVPGRLSVRPHEMATGTRTVQAGEQSLDSLKNYSVYVPTQCVGTQRCPLVVFLHGLDGSRKWVMELQRPLADKYGMILLAPLGARWYDQGGFLSGPTLNKSIVKGIDTAMKQVLRTLAIDPDKIALAGLSDGADYAFFLGHANLDVFSRIALISPFSLEEFDSDSTSAGRQPQTTQFFLSGSLGELRFVQTSLLLAEALRREGHTVEQCLALRGYEGRVEDFEQTGHWLQESWAAPGGATQAAPHAVAGPIPVLTTSALTQLITFWTRFMQEPDSIRMTARTAHQTRVPVLVGQQQMMVTMMDVTVLAAKYRTVAADLNAAGLTAQQAEAYRLALISAGAARQVRRLAETIDTTSVRGKNIAFLDTHRDALKMLGTTGMWTTP